MIKRPLFPDIEGLSCKNAGTQVDRRVMVWKLGKKWLLEPQEGRVGPKATWD